MHIQYTYTYILIVCCIRSKDKGVCNIANMKHEFDRKPRSVEVSRMEQESTCCELQCDLNISILHPVMTKKITKIIRQICYLNSMKMK